MAIALMALGLGAASYGILIGSGGGFIVSPMLLLLFQMEHNVAVGTSLVAVFLASVSGSISYLRLHRIDLRSGLLFAIAAIPGVILGVVGVSAVTGSTFKVVFGVVLCLTGLVVLMRPLPSSEGRSRGLANGPNVARKESESAVSKPRFGMTTRRIITAEKRVYQYSFLEPAAVAVNVVFGFASGFFGIGGGPLRSPTLVYAFRFPVHIAVATSVFTQSIYTGVGSIGHLVSGNVSVPAALLVGGSVVIGAQIAVRLSRVIQARWILRLLALALVGIGIQLLVAGL